MPFKTSILKNFAKFTRKHLCRSQTLPYVSSCELCQINKKTFFTELLRSLTPNDNFIEPHYKGSH